MWYIWLVLWLLTLDRLFQLGSHGDFLPFCRGGFLTTLQLIFDWRPLGLVQLSRRWLHLVIELTCFIQDLGTSKCLGKIERGLHPPSFAYNSHIVSGQVHSSSCGGKPGPKSGKCWLNWQRLPGWRLLFFWLTMISSTRGEGCERPVAFTEVPQSNWITDFVKLGTKQHGTRPAFCLDSLSRSSADTAVKKRSLRRAFHRACRDGISWYKGCPYTPADFPKGLQATWNPASISAPLQPSGKTDLSNFNYKHRSTRRIQILSWNTGGLSQAKLDEIRTWALTQNVQIISLQETRWPWIGEWEDPHFSYVHSGVTGDKSGGILMMVSKQLCQAHALRWCDPVPGRLLHLQLRLQPRTLDLVACYQHCYAPRPGRLAERQRWWDQFTALIGNLPTRHVLTIMGDLNCSLPQARSHVGLQDFAWGGHDMLVLSIVIKMSCFILYAHTICAF